jgi:hypothetical protein
MDRHAHAALDARTTTPRPLLAVLAAALTLAVVGAYLAAGVLGGGADHDTGAVAKGPFALHDPAPTSFGVVAIEHAEKTAGPTAKALGGMTHGIKGRVKADQVQVQAFATITNLSHRVVEYSPAQFSLLVGSKSAKPRPITTSSIKPGSLQPNAAIDARLSFVAPRKGQKLWVRFKDPARNAPIFIDLGRVSKAPKGALAGEHTTSHGK